MPPERLIDDLRDGQAIQVSLAPDGLDPAALDMEGNALGLLGGIAGLSEDHLAVAPPNHEFLQGRYHGDNPVIRGRSLGTLLAGCSHGVPLEQECIHDVYLSRQKYTIGIHMYTMGYVPSF